jgi:hypothetical protein
MMRRWIILSLPLILLGCRSADKRDAGLEDARGVHLSAEQARQDLWDLYERFAVRVQTAADEIARATDDREIRRKSVIWKMRMIPDCRSVFDEPEIPLAAAGFAVLCMQMEDYLTKGEGKNLFGRWQPIAVKAAEECRRDFQEITKQLMKKEAREAAENAVREYADTHPITGVFVRQPYRPRLEAKTDNVAAQIVQISLDSLKAPFKPFNVAGGIDNAAEAVREFTAVAEGIGRTVAYLPQEVRWHLELVLYDLDSLPSLDKVVAGVDEVSKNTTRFAGSAEKLVETADRLPASVGKEVATVLEEFETRQGPLQKTIGEAREAIQAADSTVRGFHEVSGALEQTAANLAKAGGAWDGAIRALHEMLVYLGAGETPAGGERGGRGAEEPAVPEVPESGAGSRKEAHPFDVREFSVAADNLARAANELRQLTVEANRLVASPDLSDRLKDVDTTTRSTVDHVAWRVIQVAIVVFVLALVYSFVRVFVIRRAARRG